MRLEEILETCIQNQQQHRKLCRCTDGPTTTNNNMISLNQLVNMVLDPISSKYTSPSNHYLPLRQEKYLIKQPILTSWAYSPEIGRYCSSIGYRRPGTCKHRAQQYKHHKHKYMYVQHKHYWLITSHTLLTDIISVKVAGKKKITIKFKSLKSCDLKYYWCSATNVHRQCISCY